MIVTKNGDPPTSLDRPFTRLRKEDMKYKLDDVHEAKVIQYNGPKRPPMKVPDGINDMEFENLQLSSYNRAMKIDFAFFKTSYLSLTALNTMDTAAN